MCRLLMHNRSGIRVWTVTPMPQRVNRAMQYNGPIARPPLHSSEAFLVDPFIARLS